jgi:hypothetical protein
MVLLRIPPLACFQDLSRNAALPPLLVHFICNFSRNLLLLGIVVENRAAVLRADIRALAVLGRWVVHLVEKLEESAVLNLIRVVDDLERFGIYRMVNDERAQLQACARDAQRNTREKESTHVQSARCIQPYIPGCLCRRQCIRRVHRTALIFQIAGGTCAQRPRNILLRRWRFARLQARSWGQRARKTCC